MRSPSPLTWPNHASTRIPLTRRDFLRRTAVGLTAAAVLPGGLGAAEIAPNPDWKPRLSTSSIHFRKLPLEQACERIGKLGFEAIDIWSAYEGCPHLDDALKLGPEALRGMLQKHRLKLYAFSTYVGGYEKYASLLGQAGGGVAIQGSAGPCPPAELKTRTKDFLESLKPLADLAEKHNSYLAIENHGDALLNTLDSFKAFTDLNASPRIGVALAPYHLQSIGASVEEAIMISGKQLFFFYAWQHQSGVNQLPGHGTTDFAPWLKALAAVNYRWYVNPFMHGEGEPDAMTEALKKSRAYLEKTAKI